MLYYIISYFVISYYIKSYYMISYYIILYYIILYHFYCYSRIVCFAGHVHVGMYTGAIGILDGYGMRGYLLDLAAQGYDIKTVGHSLGAGIKLFIIYLRIDEYIHLYIYVCIYLCI